MVIPGRRTVLVADDEPTARENLERLLKGSEYEVTVAANGHEALALSLSQDFEVVLLDIKMPGISGMDILRQIHGDRPETSIIMVTAVGDVETAVEAMKIGAVDYVLKPFNLDDILVRVDKARERWYLALRVKDYQKNLEEKVTQQTKELRDMMVHTINTMFREEVTSQTSGDHGKKRNGPGVDIKELGAKIHRRLSGIG